jgi:protoheme IX farnesyltransferase
MNGTIELNEAAPVLLRTRVGTFVELTKPRIGGLVLVATAVGFFMALPVGTGMSAVALLFHALLGTALVAAGANALNQWLESAHDAKMIRTSGRPIPSGRLTSLEVAAFGVACGAAGVLYLAVLVNAWASLIATVTLVTYVFAYTPLKRVTPLCVFAGAVPGALPPVIGWASATGSLAFEAWMLFAIVFFWQLPHFASIAWLYRDDYARAGYPMLPVVDRVGVRSDLHMVTHSVGLLAVTLVPTFYGLTGAVYTFGAMLLGLSFLAVGVLFLVNKTESTARRHVLASVVYLPLLLMLMVIDKVLPV